MTTTVTPDRITRAWAELPYAFRATHPLPPRLSPFQERADALVRDAEVAVAALRSTADAYCDRGDFEGAMEMVDYAESFQDLLDAVEDAR